MIILITGATHTGKTLLAQKVVARYGYSCLSVDLLKMGLIRSGVARLTPEDDARLEVFLWPIVREIMKTAIENGQDLVVEGGYIPPDWKKDLADDYLREIRAFCLVMSRRHIETHFAEIKKHACAAERRGDDAWCTKSLLLAENARYAATWREYGERILIDGDYAVDIALREEPPKTRAQCADG